MKRLGIHSIIQLVQWTLSAQKSEIAELAPIVLSFWKQKDQLAQRVIETSIDDLSEDLVCLIEKLNSNHKLDSASVGLTGSLFSKDTDFAEFFQERLRFKLARLQQTVSVSVKILQNTTLGSLRMLDSLKWKNLPVFDLDTDTSATLCDANAIRSEKEKHLAQTILPLALGLSLTEKRNEKSMNLDKMDVEEAIELMISEDQSIFSKISKNKTSIGILVDNVCRAFQSGGRLFYVGAGTSGRLGNQFGLSASKFVLKDLIC